MVGDVCRHVRADVAIQGKKWNVFRHVSEDVPWYVGWPAVDACGLLIYQAGGVKIGKNTFSGNEKLELTRAVAPKLTCTPFWAMKSTGP